jgi:hypothetical protein
MSPSSLDQLLREAPVPPATEAREHAVAEARAEIVSRADGAPAFRPRRRRVLIAIAAALVAVALLTPPGRAASAWVGDLVGIGEVGGPPSSPKNGDFVEKGTAVVIDNGRAPDGSRYEWIAYKCSLPLTEEHESKKVSGIGIALTWPGTKQGGVGGACEELEGRPSPASGAIGGSVHIVPSQFTGVDHPDLVISGQTAPSVHEVAVFYREPNGERHELPVDFARVEGKLGELAGRPEPLGVFVAFLSGKTAARDEVETRLDLRALETTGTLKLGPIARRERELAHAARERCEHLQPNPSELPRDPNANEELMRLFAPLRQCLEREMPPSPFEYVAYDEHGREIARNSEPLVTAMMEVPHELPPAGRERPGE